MSEIDPSEFIRKGGDTMAGPLTLAGLATEPFEAMPLGQLSSVHVDGGTPGDPGTVLENVATVTILGGLKSLIVMWTETPAVHGHGYYKVDIATNITFSAGLQTAQTKATVAAFDGLVTGNTYYARVTPITAEGTVGNTTVGNPIILGGASGADIASAAIDTVHISDDAITAPKILAGTITALQIAGGTITGDKIAGNTIAGSKIIAGTSIDSPVITGGTLQTASSGARVVITGATRQRVTFYNSAGQEAGYIQGDAFGSSQTILIQANHDITLNPGGVNAVRVAGAAVLDENSHSHNNFGTTGANGAYTNGDGSANYTGGVVSSTLGAQSGTSEVSGHSHLVNKHKHDLGTHTHTFTF